MQIHELTALARNSKASDIHISEGLPLMFRIDGHLAEAPVQLSAAETRSLILSLMDEAHREAITSERIDADFALVAPDGTRSRVNVFYQQGRAAATLRLLNDSIPTLEELAMPPVLTKLADEPRGLILVTGPTGSGKSTTLAAMIDHINKTRSDHIITIEDPIEYVYQGRQALIHQREVGADARQLALGLVWKVAVEVLRDHKAEDRIAQKFETLVVRQVPFAVFIGIRAVCQRVFQQRLISERISKPLFKFRQHAPAPSALPSSQCCPECPA